MSSTIQILNACSEKLLQIDQRVDKLRSSERVFPAAPPPTPEPESSSAVVFIAEILSEVMASATGTKPKRAEPRCHECHGPIHGYHKNYPHGVNICELEHYDMCEGYISEGKNKSGHYWRGCPRGYSPPSRTDNIGGDTLEKESVASSSLESDDGSGDDTPYQPPNRLSPANRDTIRTRSAAAEMDGQMAADFGDLDLEDNTNIPPPIQKNPLGKSKEDLLLEAEIAEIEVLKEREKKMDLLRNVRLEKQRMKDKLEQLDSQELREKDRRNKSLHETVDRMQATTREDIQPRRSAVYSGPDMNTIRRDEYTRRRVDIDMEDIVNIPALSNARTDIQTRRGVPVPRLKSSGRRKAEFSDDEPVYQERK